MKIADIEGIGPIFAEKLGGAGVETTDALLEMGATRNGREDLAEKSGLSPQQILEWVNRADLYRVKGIGSEYSDLLEMAGVDTVPELAQRNAANLAAKIAELAASRSIVQRVPAEKEISGWIEQARNLARIVEY